MAGLAPLRCALLVASPLWLLGCLYQGSARSVEASAVNAAHLEGVEHFPVLRQPGQQDCGATALAATLQYWGVDTGPSDVRAAVGGSSRQPIRADALRDHARRLGFDAFLIRGDTADLRVELAADRPVIVGTLKPYVGDQWFAHYEVVTGIGDSEVITMDPAKGWRRYPLDGFDAEWSRTDHLTLIIAPR